MTAFVEVAPGIFTGCVFEAGEAQAVIARAEASQSWVLASINAALIVDTSIREADVLFEPSAPELYATLRDRLFDATRDLAVRLAPGSVLAEIQIVRYMPGGNYAEHRDSPRKGATARVLSIVAYLNDGFAGGETSFADAAFDVTPIAGLAVVFAPELLHCARAVRSGTKYIVTAWYHTPPVREPEA